MIDFRISKKCLQLKFILILYLTIYITPSIFGQNTETDSLKKALASTKEDTKRVLTLEALSYAYVSSYSDTALQFALEGLRLAKKIKYRKGEAACINALGNVYFSAGDYAKALQLYLQYLEIKEGLKERRTMGVAYFNLANVYTEMKDYRHALFYLFKAKQEDERSKDSIGILFDLYSLGSIYLRMHKVDSALHNFNQSYNLAERMDDRNILAAILNGYAETYLLTKDTSLATKYYNLSIPYAAAIKDNEVLTSNYLGLSKVFYKQDFLDSAVYYARKALLTAKEGPFLKQMVEVSTFLTELYSTKKKFDSAFYYQQISIATKDSLFNVEQVKKVQNLKFEEYQRQQVIETENLKYRNKVKLFLVIVASVIFLGIAAVLWRNNKQKQTANALLQKEKDKVELTLAELRQTQAQLIQAEKMASLGELTAGIAHEIQNPLNFVNNFSELNTELIDELRTVLKKGNPEEAFVISTNIQENEQKINHHGKRADTIVKGMLQHSKATTGQRELTNINALADEYLRLAFHGLRAKDKSFNATLKTNFDENIGNINIVPKDIGRVLLNLYNNAFYAVAEQRKQRPDGFEPTVSVTTKRKNSKIETIVSDNGTGIRPKELHKIFQPFFTTKPAGQGTGLGLSLSYDIIKAHGGEIRVESKEGEGSEFIITLPV